ncbi:hypothetical protein J3459_007455 [Metarhizium acridum]|nr:hypothetical protein J3459_007455 [Metarhizium acridum]
MTFGLVQNVRIVWASLLVCSVFEARPRKPMQVIVVSSRWFYKLQQPPRGAQEVLKPCAVCHEVPVTPTATALTWASDRFCIYALSVRHERPSENHIAETEA